MAYKITVEEITGEDERGYEKKRTVYEQRLEELSVADLAVFLNGTKTVPPVIIPVKS